MNKQLVCKETGKFTVQEVEIPKAPDDGMVVQIHYSGVCHSDASMFYAPFLQPIRPSIYGHEMSGTVHELGKSYNEGKLSVGDRVAVYPWVGCRNCDNCRAGDNNICVNRDIPGAEVYGVRVHGGYQQYVLLRNTWCVVPVPDNLPLHVACMVPCSGITSYNALRQCKDSLTRTINASGKANLLIVGAGGLGLWAIQIARTLYGDSVKIVAADINEEKITEAKSSGADDGAQLPKEGDAKESAEKVKACFGGEGADAAIDFVNISSTFETIFYSLRNGSTSVMVGLTRSPLPQIPIGDFIMKGVRIQAIYTSSKQDIEHVFQLLLEKKIQGPKTEFIKLEEVASIFQKMKAGTMTSGRAIVDMGTFQSK